MASRAWPIVAVLASVVLWGVAVWRLTTQHARRTPPEQFLTFVSPDGEGLGPNPTFPHCHGTTIIAPDRAWRICDLDARDRSFVVRFELDRGRAVMLPLPGRHTWMTAAAVDGRGRLAVITDTAKAFVVDGDRVEPARVQAHRLIAGLAWVDGALASVWSGSFPPPPRGTVRRAWREGGGWRLAATDDETPDRILVGDERGAWTEVEIEPTEPFRLELEVPASGVLQWSPRPWADVRELRDGRWQRLEHPLPAEADRYEYVGHDYRIEDGVLVGQPRMHQHSEALVATPSGWLGLGYEYDGREDHLFLHDLGGTRGPRIVDWGWLDGRASVVPASRGGVWLLGAFGTYVRVDGLRRASGTSLLDRLRAHHASFDRLGMYNDWYGERVLMKRAAIPVVLLGLPLVMLTAAITWALRRRRVRAGALFGGVAVLYLVVALAMLSTFWDVTSRF